MQEFDKAYWDNHWVGTATGPDRSLPVNPYVPAETAHLAAGTALDAGCGTGNEALWLAEQGWQVTGADISATALSTAAHRSDRAGLTAQVQWIEADLTDWTPGRDWDLVVTNYAHSAAGQLAFYERIASWVAPGGTLLIVGHLHDHEHHEHGHHGQHPEGATATLTGITELFTAPDWRVDSSYEATRTVYPGGRAVQLSDVVVRAHRTP
jgi:SAM-dependent methyltransferase